MTPMLYRPDLAEQIKSRLTIREVCERYGVHFNQRGKAKCPFHDDVHPSADIKYGKFNCWSACNLHLDIFDFTERMFHINFKQAIVRLDSDFALGITGQKPDYAAYDRWKTEQRRKESISAAYTDEYNRNVCLHRYIHNAYKVAGSVRNDRQALRRARWAETMEYLEYFFNTHPAPECVGSDFLEKWDEEKRKSISAVRTTAIPSL